MTNRWWGLRRVSQSSATYEYISSLAAFYWDHSAASKCYSHYWATCELEVNTILVMTIILFFLTQLHWPLSWSVALQWRLLKCHCQTNWKPVLSDLFSEFPVVADTTFPFSAVSALDGVACLDAVQLRKTALVTNLEKNVLLEDPFWARCPLLLCSLPFAWLQPRYDAGWGFAPSTRAQLQQHGVDPVFVFSGHSLCRWPPPHHKHQGGCLQLVQTWLKFWQL
jgi:hypothetical protein